VSVPYLVMINILNLYTEKGQRSNRFPHQGIVLVKHNDPVVCVVPQELQTADDDDMDWIERF